MVAAQLLGSWYLRGALRDRAARYQRGLEVEDVWVLWPGHLSLHGVRLTHGDETDAVAARVSIDYSLSSLLSGDLSISQLRVQGAELWLRRAPDGTDNFSDLLRPRAGDGDGGGEGGGRLSRALAEAELLIEGGQLHASLLTAESGTLFEARDLRVQLPAHGAGSVALSDVVLRAPEQEPVFLAESVLVYAVRDGKKAELAGLSLLHPVISLSRQADFGLPSAGARAVYQDLKQLRGGPAQETAREADPKRSRLERALSLLPTLELLDAEITVRDGDFRLSVHSVSARASVVASAAPGAARGESPLLTFHANGGAPGDDAGWSADGSFDPSRDALSLRLDANRVGLKDFSPYMEGARFVDPGAASFDLDLAIDYTAGRELYTRGSFGLSHLTIDHPRLAKNPIRDISFSIEGDARYDLTKRALVITRAKVQREKAIVSLDGTITRRQDGTAQYKFHAEMPKINCGDLFGAIPPDLVPVLEGFTLGGTFLFDLDLDLDTASLDKMTLEGDLDLNRCKVVSAGPKVRVSLEDLRDGTFTQVVEEANGKTYEFAVGADADDWTPLDSISPYLVQGIITTEDGGFFSHKGFSSVQVLRSVVENVAAGRFKRGASTISMQFVKNVLLTREKTISRKLQEMVLTWWVEQNLTKERILALYFNLIEFGPGIYGIHDASYHYFEVPPRLLTPWQAAYLLSIIPNPKKYHSMFEEGEVGPSWTARVRRILTHMHSKGRLTDEEYAEAMAAPIVFGAQAPSSQPASQPSSQPAPESN